jgi:hypothetical protein
MPTKKDGKKTKKQKCIRRISCVKGNQENENSESNSKSERENDSDVEIDIIREGNSVTLTEVQAKVDTYRKKILEQQNNLRKRILETMTSAADGIRRVVLNLGKSKYLIEVPLTLDALLMRIGEKLGSKTTNNYKLHSNGYIIDRTPRLLYRVCDWQCSD